VDGKLQNRFLDLGYDAATRPRRYVFEWFPDEILWYGGDKLLLRVARNETDLPKMPGHLFVNIWAADPSIAGWSGVVAEGTKAKALVKRVQFTPMAQLRRAGDRETEHPVVTRTIATTEFVGHRSAE